MVILEEFIMEKHDDNNNFNKRIIDFGLFYQIENSKNILKLITNNIKINKHINKEQSIDEEIKYYQDIERELDLIDSIEEIINN